MPLKRTAQSIYEFACHEGNYLLMTGMLSAAHAREKPAQDVPR
jgi:hypothetical protein